MKTKVLAINNGNSYIKHISADCIKNITVREDCYATAEFSNLHDMEVIIICVPTPLNQHREPDMQYIESTVKMISKYLQPGQLIVLESTTYPGTTNRIGKTYFGKIRINSWR